MPDTSLSHPVGAGRRPPGNADKDCDKVRDWLMSIPAGNGGTASIPASDGGSLARAIETFQRRHVPAHVDGWIQPGGRTWGKIMEVLKLAVPPVSTGGPKDFKPIPRETAFKQWDDIWIKQTLNASTHTLWAKGCLLTATASALAYKGLRLPADRATRDAVRAVLARKIPATLAEHDRLFGPDKITPASLEAWMSLNDGQGYDGAASADLKPSLTHLLAPGNRDVTFWGQHSGKVKDPRFRYLDLPTPEQLRRWLNKGHILIAMPRFDDHHWLWITGHNGAEQFTVWDVGYSPGDDEFTKTITAADILVMDHWGSTTSLA